LEGPVAQAEVERAVELDPSDYEALTWLGNMRSRAGDLKGAIEAYRKVVEMEPFFWPAAFNLYGTLNIANDSAGMKQLLEQLHRVGADYLAEQLEVDALYRQGNLAQAANLGLKYWIKSAKDREATPALADLWIVLLQLGFYDEAHNMGPAPDFALDLWKLDPKGLDLLEAHDMTPAAFFSLQPLTENAARLYLLAGRGKKLADMYLSLKVTPEQFAMLARGDGPEHFIISAPLMAIALRQNGHAPEADALLSLAEAQAKQLPGNDDSTRSALLARIYAVQGRKDQAVSLLTSAVNRRWMPQAPEILPDLHSDPALASLKGDPRFEKLRDQIMGTIARERAQVNLQLLAQLKAA
jgi:tetratricopeptide (TPR) repeat protein